MTGADRLNSSPKRPSSSSTSSTRSPVNLTLVTLATAVPTDTRHTKSTFSTLSGAGRTMRATAADKSDCMGSMRQRPRARERQVYHSGVRLILASSSPRRAELLRAAGYSFDVVPADVDESAEPGEAPEEYVRRVSAAKARAIIRRFPECTVLAADTTVVVDGIMLGKPSDDEDARHMLSLLSGRAHRVLTGVAIAGGEREVGAVASTLVRFAVMTAEDIDWYVASGEPRDKAGAYGVQGLASRFVDSIEGSYTNVVGLPVALVHALLAETGFMTTAGARGDSPGAGPERIDRTCRQGYPE